MVILEIGRPLERQRRVLWEELREVLRDPAPERMTERLRLLAFLLAMSGSGIGGVSSSTSSTTIRSDTPGFVSVPFLCVDFESANTTVLRSVVGLPPVESEDVMLQRSSMKRTLACGRGVAISVAPDVSFMIAVSKIFFSVNG